MKKIVIVLIRAYQLAISPLFPPSCRYYPSCSQYAVEAVSKHGALKGSFLAVRRVLRCHPGCPGGIDHVPDQLSGCEHANRSDRKSNEMINN